MFFLACFSKTASTRHGWRLGSAQMHKFIQDISSHVPSVKGMIILSYYNCIRNKAFTRDFKTSFSIRLLQQKFIVCVENTACLTHICPWTRLPWCVWSHENIQTVKQGQVFPTAFKTTVWLWHLIWQFAEHRGKASSSGWEEAHLRVLQEPGQLGKLRCSPPLQRDLFLYLLMTPVIIS